MPYSYERTPRTASQNWSVRLEALRNEYMKEVLTAGEQVLKSEGFEKVRSTSNSLEGEKEGQKFHLTLKWEDRASGMKTQVQLGKERKEGKLVPLGEPKQTASQAIYKHFEGLVP